MKKARVVVCGLAVGLLCLAAPPARAVEVNEKLSLFGYGNWSYARTDGNGYAGGREDGSWEEMEYSLGVAAFPAEKVAVFAQAFFELSEGETEASVDYAFGQYTFSPALALRAGRVKQPFGIYTEIFDVGVLQPFTRLPQGIYGPSGFVAEGYMGVGASGALDLTPALRLQYDVYGGELESALTTPWVAEGGGDAGIDEDEQSTDVKDLVGGRVQVGAPDGMYTVGVSAYTGGLDATELGEEAEGDRHSAVGAHAEVMAGGFTLRAEYAHQAAETYAADAAYGEASYLITPHWRVALRYDWTKVDPDEAAGIDEEMLESTDVGVAVNYIVGPNLVVKVTYQAVDGNRFTTPDEDGAMDDKTGLFTAGVAFSF